MTEAVVDLRSDTVTRPTPAMREAMAQAEVGDDVLGEDPTINRLQERSAELLGKEAALFVPSGTMANQLALLVHCSPGDEVVVGQGSHTVNYEGGAGAMLAGVQFAAVGAGGTFTHEELDEAVRPTAYYMPRSRLVCIENTHNAGGGIVWPVPQLADVAETARWHDLRMHLDGARLFNAAAACGRSPGELAAPFDTATFCLSKGLGAPVGSMLAGPSSIIERAHRLRRMLGGGMRQAGILAAAGLHALDHHLERLGQDHENARLFGTALGGIEGVAVGSAIGQIETNIVLVELDEEHPLDAAQVVELARERGVLVIALGPRRIRAVTHLDVDAEACARAGATLATILALS